MSDSIRVAVADDHPMFRAGVIQTLKIARGFDVVGEGSNAAEAVQLANDLRPDVILLDLNMPGGGLEAAAEIARSCPEVRVIILTVSELEENVASSLQAGVRGYILKGSCGSELTRVVQMVCDGESYVSPGLAARLFTQQRQKAKPAGDEQLSELTSREREIMDQVSRGLTNKEIARNLSLSEKTIKHYMSNIMQKLRARNRVEAVLNMRRKIQ
jgi:two-component system, NarL family, nitrate/nitrite response regulator NarL